MSSNVLLVSRRRKIRRVTRENCNHADVATTCRRRLTKSARGMIRGWDDEDVIDAEEIRAKRKEKSGVGRGLIGRHHNRSMRGRAAETFLAAQPLPVLDFSVRAKTPWSSLPTRLAFTITFRLSSNIDSISCSNEKSYC